VGRSGRSCVIVIEVPSGVAGDCGFEGFDSPVCVTGSQCEVCVG
jgi:hypothetical protein